MKSIALAAVICLVSYQASAVDRYEASSMSCAQVQAAIQADGAVILYRTAKDYPGLPLYDRYVKSLNFCDSSQTIVRSSVAASDTKSCPVMHCKNVSRSGY